MPFPADPNAPGGPRRSEYVRRGYAAADAARAGGSDMVEALADPALTQTGVLTLLLMRRLEARMIVSIFGA